MFTGIVEELGSVVAVDQLPGEAARLTVRGPLITADATPGDSISVNGVCLTVAELDGEAFTADVMAETLRRTTLGRLASGEPVNLERALTPSSRMGGHVVQGHVDGVGTVAACEPAEHWTLLRIDAPRDLARYLVEKGSVAVDGVSLTVVDTTAPEAERAAFSVSLIPETLRRTTLGRRAVGEPVNLEVDVLAKYVERLVSR